MEYKFNLMNLADIDFDIKCKFQLYPNSFNIHQDTLNIMNLINLCCFKTINNILVDMFCLIKNFCINIFQHLSEESYSECHYKNSKKYYQIYCRKHMGISKQYQVPTQLIIIQLQTKATSLKMSYIRNLFSMNFKYFIKMD